MYTTRELDREQVAEYDIEIVATDHGTPSKVYTAGAIADSVVVKRFGYNLFCTFFFAVVIFSYRKIKSGGRQ